MKITKVNLKKLNEPFYKGVLAVASIVIDDCFIINDIRVVRTFKDDSRIIVAMPVKKNKFNEYKEICHPLKKETRAMIEEAVLNEYNKK